MLDVHGGGHKITIDAVIPPPAYPNDSKNVGLRKRHEKITDSKVIVFMDRFHLEFVPAREMSQ